MAIGMSRREQWALIGVVALLALGAGFQAWRRANSDGPVVYVPGQGRWEKVADFEAGKHPGPLAVQPNGAGVKADDGATSGSGGGGIDLNRATLEELDRLPGIGAARAAAILELRGKLGGFSSVEQLDQVSGIGAKTLARLRPFVRVAAGGTSRMAMGTPAAPAAVLPLSPDAPGAKVEAAAPAVKAPAGEKAESAAPVMVDINQAGAGELQQVKGLGPALAGRIVEDRKLHGPYRSVEELTRVKGIGPVSLQKMKPQLRVGAGRP